MDVLPNPAKEAINRRKHGLDFSRVGKIFDLPYSVEIDDRPLGYEHEVRLKLIGFLGGRVRAVQFCFGKPYARRRSRLRALV
jgi:uncharacterized DUF497 family protein